MGAFGQYDLLALIFHEFGHSLGLSWPQRMEDETLPDNDYDFDSSFVAGAHISAECHPDGRNHLASEDALMFTGLGGTGRRKLPSATDVFTMASGDDYTHIDLPRKELWSTGGDGNDVALASQVIPAPAVLPLLAMWVFIPRRQRRCLRITSRRLPARL